MSLAELQKYTFTAKYARWNKDLKRRETWNEAVLRVKNMMLEKYKDKPEVHADIDFAYDMMKKKNPDGKWLSSKKATFCTRYSHFNRCNGYTVRKIFEEFDDGEINDNELRGAFDCLAQLISKQNQMWQDWDKRFKARVQK